MILSGRIFKKVTARILSESVILFWLGILKMGTEGIEPPSPGLEPGSLPLAYAPDFITRNVYFLMLFISIFLSLQFRRQKQLRPSSSLRKEAHQELEDHQAN